MNKPFLFGTIVSGENFTDRENESKRLQNNFEYGINTIIISPRRWGKTSLVEKVSSLINQTKIKVVKIDIFSCRKREEFYSELATALIKQTSSKLDEWLESVKIFMSNIVPKISIGPDPMQDFSLSFDYEASETLGDDILKLPEIIAQKKNIQIVVCIDEFQQIGEFADSMSFQKKLRSVWQRQKNVSYCLYGSKKHLMTELFGKQSKPFYKFGDILFLEKIDTAHWINFIQQRFEETGKHISADLSEKICQMAQNHSYYVQQLAWFVWLHIEKGETASELNLEDAINDIITSNLELFQQQTRSLTAYQLNFLRAISDGINSAFTTQKVISNYKLGSSANVGKIKKSLIEQEIITENNKTYFFSDPIMQIWFKKYGI